MNQSNGTQTGPMATDPASDDPGAHVQLTAGHAAIVGLQFGDEGKGQIVDMLSPQFDVIVRYNGGANAGHSVQFGDQKFSVHLIPSGIFCPQKLNVVANGVVIDPTQMVAEVDGLRQRGIAIAENLRVSNRAHVVVAYHKIQDRLYDQALAQGGRGVTALGTTGRGIGPCYADKALRTTAIRMADLLCPHELQRRLVGVVSIKNAVLSALAKTCSQPFEPFDASVIGAELLEQAQRLRPHICDTAKLLYQADTAGKRILFEGANAVLLDIDHGTYPFVTSSHCSSLGIYSGTGLPTAVPREVLGVLKLYTSRVGGGPFPTELQDETAQRLRDVGNEYGTTTGRPRRCGWLDLAAIRYASRICGVTALACTGLSVLAGLEKLKACVGYRHKGRILDDFPAEATVLGEVEPIYEQFDGFAGPIDTCRGFENLPQQARQYLRFVENFTGTPIVITCVGRRRDQTLTRSQSKTFGKA